MQKLIRFGVSMEKSLLAKFDKLIGKKGYTNRSEAIRDIVRDKLVEENIQESTGEVFGALVYIYDHHKRELEKSLANLQHDYYRNIISTSHVHLDHDHCFEVILLRGEAGTLKKISEKLLSFKGVKHGKLTLTTSLTKNPQTINHHHN
ncbi:MAG: nickel-responsive transcriptional regulator NikR [Bacteroidota bacterium]|nr:nickel-responsive transcriptional regulator NikR [Bacteroidota bacterium]